MSAELWRVDENKLFLYVEAIHQREIQNIKRSRNWRIVATYTKNKRVIAYQYAVPVFDYRKAKRIFKKCT